MTKLEQDSLILDSLDAVVCIARAFYPDSKQFSMAWIARDDNENGDYICFSNPYYEETDDSKKLHIYRLGEDYHNDFPNGGDQAE